MSETFDWCKDKTKLASLNKRMLRINRDGDKYWYLNGKYHRQNGPAVEYANGDRVWYLNGQLHRENGPAVEYPNEYSITKYGVW